MISYRFRRSHPAQARVVARATLVRLCYLHAGETAVSQYLAGIGRKGGKKSRRRLSSDQARDMVRVCDLRRAFAEYYARCFWYCALTPI